MLLIHKYYSNTDVFCMFYGYLKDVQRCPVFAPFIPLFKQKIFLLQGDFHSSTMMAYVDWDGAFLLSECTVKHQVYRQQIVLPPEPKTSSFQPCDESKFTSINIFVE